MSIEDKIHECNKLYDNEDFKALLEKCDEILEQCPDNQIAMGYKGFALYALGEYGKAMEILERGVELYPENHYLKNNLAMVHYALGEYETSLRLCDEGLKISDFYWLCENKFKSLIRLGRYDEAIEFEKSMDNELDLYDVFFEKGMGEHELSYYQHCLKDDPDDWDVIDQIKMLAAKSGVEPEVGDSYLKWIDAIRQVNEKPVCPDCGGKLIPIIWGYPSSDLLEKSLRGEVYLGGCVITIPTNFHCKSCEKEFCIDYEDVQVECENPRLKEYVLERISSLEMLLTMHSKKGVEAEEVKSSVSLYDDKEFDMFISRLVEIGYIVRDEDGHIRLAGDGNE
ncbi:tetratricopeptide repeat protein [Methanobrevibacter sp.]|uniref:tetratricopeptide repeat protein n=1 Tax=Methanobrevibacter sp. TaxID=66852 RepID=UPI0025CE417C|nr:tetratricopeptide repeat protein [Methanobrevibacter sp.]MBR4447201.1 tetratricopeptide repeat protein [Methanobrevibacter sp.]